MVELNVSKTKDNVSKMLEEVRRKMPNIDQTIRNAIGWTIVGWAQKNKLRGQVLHRRTGDLADSLIAKEKGTSTTIVGSFGVPYARIHEYGGTIKRRPTSKGWRMPKRPYLLPSIHEVFDSGEAMRVAETRLNKALKEIENANSG